jgi:hypothetical protein
VSNTEEMSPVTLEICQQRNNLKANYNGLKKRMQNEEMEEQV